MVRLRPRPAGPRLTVESVSGWDVGPRPGPLKCPEVRNGQLTPISAVKFPSNTPKETSGVCPSNLPTDRISFLSHYNRRESLESNPPVTGDLVHRPPRPTDVLLHLDSTLPRLPTDAKTTHLFFTPLYTITVSLVEHASGTTDFVVHYPQTPSTSVFSNLNWGDFVFFTELLPFHSLCPSGLSSDDIPTSVSCPFRRLTTAPIRS